MDTPEYMYGCTCNLSYRACRQDVRWDGADFMTCTIYIILHTYIIHCTVYNMYMLHDIIFGIYVVSYIRYVHIYIHSWGMRGPEVDDWTMGIFSILASVVAVTDSRETLTGEKLDHRVSRVYISIYVIVNGLNRTGRTNRFQGGGSESGTER
jgi:hypothetical protein